MFQEKRGVVQQEITKTSVVDEPILDTTPAAQITVEEKVMAGEAPTPEELEAAAAASGPEPETPEVVEAPAAPTPTAGAAPKVEPPPVPRVYTDEQVRQMQSSWDRQINQERQRAAASEKRLQEFDLNASVEAHLRSQERRLETSLGVTPEQARSEVRTPENERQVREQVGAQQRVRVLEEQQIATAVESERNAAVVTAQLFMQRYGVPAEDAELLLTAPTPVHMEKLAQRLGTKAKATTEATKTLRGQVPVETPKTTLESGMSGTAAPESIDRMAERLNAVPSWEWSARERKFMQTGRQE